MQLSVAAEHHQALKQSCRRAEVVSARLANHHGELVLVLPLQPLGNLYIILDALLSRMQFARPQRLVLRLMVSERSGRDMILDSWINLGVRGDGSNGCRITSTMR